MAKQNGGAKKGRSWKQERASVTVSKRKQPRSNKYRTESDGDKKPEAGERTRAWVAGYTRSDGRRVKGHYRELTQSRTMRRRATGMNNGGSRAGTTR